MRLTKAQQRSLLRKWLQGQHEHGSTRDISYLTFRRSVQEVYYVNYNVVTVKWCGMWLAIESDGYTHS
jgi:hypothetical protein